MSSANGASTWPRTAARAVAITRLVSEARCRPVLVIHDAHHLRPDVLEDLRLLTN